MSESSKTKTKAKTKAKGKQPETKGQDGQLSCLNAAAKVPAEIAVDGHRVFRRCRFWQALASSS